MVVDPFSNIYINNNMIRKNLSSCNNSLKHLSILHPEKYRNKIPTVGWKIGGELSGSTTIAFPLLDSSYMKNINTGETPFFVVDLIF